MKAVVGAFNQEKALVGAFSVIVQPVVEPMELYTALFKDDKEPAGNPYLHMNFDAQFKWDTKDDANDKDNGFICKKAHA